MEDAKAPVPGFEKWVIIPIEADPRTTVKIDFRVPGNVRHCTGVAFSVYVANGAFNPGDYMGEISLSFNNRKSHALNYVTEFKTAGFRMDFMVTKLEEPMEGGSRIFGYYRSLIDSPQKLNVYLQCIIDSY